MKFFFFIELSSFPQFRTIRSKTELKNNIYTQRNNGTFIYSIDCDHEESLQSK